MQSEAKREVATEKPLSPVPIKIKEIQKNRIKRSVGRNEKLGDNVVITVVENRCKGCDVCVKACHANVLKLAGPEENFVVKVINPSECDKCMRCENLCPDFAIYID